MNRFPFRPLDEASVIIEEMMSTESSDVLMIDYLSVTSNAEEAKYLWRQLLTSRRRLYDWLRSVYFQLNGHWPKTDQVTFEPPATYDEGVQVQSRRLERKQDQLQQMMTQTTSAYLYQSLQIVYNHMQYEMILLRQLQRFN
ncbi:hypothetical protein [Bacillus sp. FJAT-45037]|uniref:hypothetical protein n=1 Tax=Bacillus sp. FJAT-45037 TaxID=2011007 RepID=UPI000C2356A7|nr:hypothetical protein [Bacillus sp. FJAT-45037]